MIGIALTPVTVLGSVALYGRGTAAVVLAILGLVLSSAAVGGIYFLERPLPRRSAQHVIEPEPSVRDGAHANDHAVDLDLGVRWDRDSPETWFVHRDGDAALILKPDLDDEDRRLVVLVWALCTASSVGPPNADTRQGHRRYLHGLRECAWAAEIPESSWTAPGERHFVILTKKETIEVVAPNVVVHRVDRLRLEASSGDEASS